MHNNKINFDKNKRFLSLAVVLAVGSFPIQSVWAQDKFPDTQALDEANKRTIEELANRPMHTEVIQSFGRDIAYVQQEIEVHPVQKRIWDVYLTYYTKAFAEQQGYPLNQILELPKGLEAITYTQTTVGKTLFCNLNMLLANDLGFMAPSQDYAPSMPRYGIRFPKTLEVPKSREYPKRVISESPSVTHRDYVFANAGYSGKFKSNTGGALTPNVTYYKHNYYRGYDLFSFSLGCSNLTRSVLEQGEASIWLKKAGVTTDYTQTFVLQPNDFLKIRIPQALVDAMTLLMREGFEQKQLEFEVSK